MTRAEQIASIVRAAVTSGPALTFDKLFSATEARLPDVTATEVDAAARSYESGEPGAYLYRGSSRIEPLDARRATQTRRPATPRSDSSRPPGLL